MPPTIDVYKWLGFLPTSETDDQYRGDCPFCGKDKFYVSTKDLLYSCKSGSCQKSGNIYTYLQDWWTHLRNATGDETAWTKIELNRGIPMQVLKDSGVVYDAALSKWLIPVRNGSSAIVNFRLFSIGSKLLGLPGLDVGLYGAETAPVQPDHRTRQRRTIYLCEGEWDAICFRDLIQGRDAAVLGLPGVDTLKDVWLQVFAGHDVVLCFDNDTAGVTGTAKVANKLLPVVESLSYLDWGAYLSGSRNWESSLSYDVRDFYCDFGKFEELEPYFVPFAIGTGEGKHSSAGSSTQRPTARRMPGQERPCFEQVLAAYAERLTVTQDFEWAIRIAYGVVLSEFIQGDPLWMHIVSPPSSGKTVILQSLDECDDCVLKSTLKPAALVSGFKLPDGKDPSLIPQLDGKVLVIKDYTEVLSLDKAERSKVFSHLRDAYDGLVEHIFGNGVLRRYVVHFSMLTGVTPSLYAESEASMGERFLIYHMLKGNDYDADEVIFHALENTGARDAETKRLLAETARKYLDLGVTEDEINAATKSINAPFKRKLVALAQLAASLRGQVKRDAHEDKLLYRPQAEIGTRLAKQLYKLGLALAFLEDDGQVNERVYRILVRVALDTCVGFNLDIVQALAVKGGLTVQELAEITNIPISTIRLRLDDMEMLDVIHREKEHIPNKVGPPMLRYSFSERVRRFWEKADLSSDDFSPEVTVRMKVHRRGGKPA